jgi:hypothetical protein
MRISAFAAAILFTGSVLCLPRPSGAGAPADSLWLKAVGLAEKSKDLVPGSIESYMQEVDKHGNPKHEEDFRHSWGRLSLGEDGKVEYESVKVLEKGKDVTEEERAKEAKRREKGGDEDSDGFSVEGYSPFDTEAQDRMSIVRCEETESADGKDLAVYEFVEHPGADRKEEVSGKAWLDISTGVPVKIEYTSDPLPKRVKRMTTTVEYRYSPPDTLVPERFTMDVTGGILFIKKHFHMEMTFSDHWRLPEGYDE